MQSLKGKMCMWRFFLCGVTVILSFSNGTWAQTPPDAGSLLRDQEQLQREIPDGLPAEEGQDTQPEANRDESITFTLKSVRFSGAEGLASEEELQGFVQDDIGRQLNYSDVQKIVEAIDRFLHDKGYLLARAYIPKQDVTDGNLEISILQGRLDTRDGKAVEVRGTNLRISEGRLQSIALANIAAGKTISRGELERTILLINELPGISARAVLEPGASPGTTRIIIEAREGSVLSGSSGVDNFNNRYNGEIRGNGSLSLNNPFGWGDQLTAVVSGSENKVAGIFNYQAPLGSKGLKMALSASTLGYEVGKELSGANLQGNALTFSGRISYPLRLTRKNLLSLSGGYEWKSLEDKAAGINIRNSRVDNYYINLNGWNLDGLWGGGLTTWSGSAIIGRLDIPGDTDYFTVDQATAHTNGLFQRYVYSLSRLQKLPASFSLYGGVIGQQASKNLGSSEKFSLGGPFGVRAYPVGEGSGDEGWITKLELRYNVPIKFKFGRFQLSAFADSGRIRLNESLFPGAVSNATGKNSYQLNGAGFGLKLFQGNRYNFNLSWAFPIKDNPGRSVNGMDVDGKDRKNRFWLQGNIRLF